MSGDFDNDAHEARRMVAALVEAFPAGCRDTAMKMVGHTVGLSRWSVWSLLYGRRKSVASNTMQALRRAYLELCERQIRKLKAELQAAEMRSGINDSFADLGREASALVEKLREARKRSG